MQQNAQQFQMLKLDQQRLQIVQTCSFLIGQHLLNTFILIQQKVLVHLLKRLNGNVAKTVETHYIYFFAILF